MKRRPYNILHGVWADVDEGYLIDGEILWLDPEGPMPDFAVATEDPDGFAVVHWDDGEVTLHTELGIDEP